MGGSRGGWGGGCWWGGRKESCSSRLTFLQYPSPPPSQPLVSLQHGLLREQGLHWDFCTLSCFTLLRIVPNRSSLSLFPPAPPPSLRHSYLKEGPAFFLLLNLQQIGFSASLKHALILVMPDGVRKIFAGVKHGYIKTPLLRVGFLQSWSI